MSIIDIPQWFMGVVEDMMSIFPDLGREFEGDGGWNLERVNVWWIALSKFRAETIVQAARTAAAESTKRRPLPSDIAKACRTVVGSGKDAGTQQRRSEAAQAEAEQARLARQSWSDLRELRDSLSEDELLGHAVRVVALQPAFRKWLVESRWLSLMVFIEKRIAEGLAHDENVGFDAGGCLIEIPPEAMEAVWREPRVADGSLAASLSDAL